MNEKQTFWERAVQLIRMGKVSMPGPGEGKHTAGKRGSPNARAQLLVKRKAERNQRKANRRLKARRKHVK